MGDYGKLTADQATPSPLPPPHLLQIHDFTITFRVTFCQVISPVKWKKKKAKAWSRNTFLFKPPGKCVIKELELTKLVFGGQTREEASSFEPSRLLSC